MLILLYKKATLCRKYFSIVGIRSNIGASNLDAVVREKDSDNGIYII